MKKFLSVILALITVMNFTSFADATTHNVDQELLTQINSVKTIAECNATNDALSIKTVTYGTYAQTTDPSSKEPLEWYVLDKNDEKALLLCKYVLCRKPYYKDMKAVGFESSTIMSFMNTELMDDIFTLPQKNDMPELNYKGFKSPFTLLEKTDIDTYFSSVATKPLLLTNKVRSTAMEDYWLMNRTAAMQTEYMSAYGSILKAYLNEELGVRPVITVYIK